MVTWNEYLMRHKEKGRGGRVKERKGEGKDRTETGKSREKAKGSLRNKS